MKARKHGAFAVLLCLGALVACSHPTAKVSTTWNPKTAAAYLDYRAGWWTEWQGSARDQGTFCISCHTALPYALSRPALRAALAENTPTENEQKLVQNVTKRVRLWKEIGPYYSGSGYDQKIDESRGTEAVLNALILASHDAEYGHLGPQTRAAFDNMWALQQTTGSNAGSWSWLQFNQEPWEANDSGYYGAALAAMAVGIAPENYAVTPEIQENLKRLREYLNRESAAQSTLNRVFLLWASTKLPGLLRAEQQKAIVREMLRKQQSDGGWRLASVSWKWSGWTLKSVANMWIREDGTPMEGKSDGVATSLMVLTLEEAGVPKDNAQLKRGLSWILNNQNETDGSWPASSVNKKRHQSSDTGRFMSDAATAFAVLALTDRHGIASPVTSASNLKPWEERSRFVPSANK